MPASVIDQLHIMLYIWFALLGFILGLLVALLCGRLDRGRAERSTTGREDSEREAASLEAARPTRGGIDWIELPSGAQVCCGDCYARLLLRQVSLPDLQVSSYSLLGSPGLREPDPTHRVENGGSFAKSGRESQKSGHKQRRWVEHGVSTGRVTPLTSKERNVFS